MSYIRKPSIMEQLFGSDVPLWKKLLTLATFPIWGPIGLLFILVFAMVAAGIFGAGIIVDMVHNISDK